MMAIQRAGIDSCPAIISFVETRPARLRGCFCNAAGSPVRKGFMDNAAFASKIGGNLAYRVPLRTQGGNLGGV